MRGIDEDGQSSIGDGLLERSEFDGGIAAFDLANLGQDDQGINAWYPQPNSYVDALALEPSRVS